MNLFLSLSIICFLFGCQGDKSKLKCDTNLIEEKNVKENNIIYQYYEKFGFTDVSKHYRSLYTIDNFVLPEKLDKLPIKKSDLLFINALSNKIDKIDSRKIKIPYQFKDRFNDIMLDNFEYYDSSFKINSISLKNGFYELNKNGFKIYNPQTKTIYSEYYE